MGSRDLCELGLGISSVEERKSFETDDTVKMPEFPSRTLTLFGETFYENSQPVTAVIGVNDHRLVEVYGQETERVSSRISDEDDEGSNGRKKLRLTRNQSAHLEESFKRHSTLNPKQKQDLARELNLRPRQIEVWFQNRRARTKLKQTEINCEFLKKCFETLTEENRWLQKELQELKAVKFSQPLYMQIPAATLRVCPACEKII